MLPPSEARMRRTPIVTWGPLALVVLYASCGAERRRAPDAAPPAATGRAQDAPGHWPAADASLADRLRRAIADAVVVTVPAGPVLSRARAGTAFGDPSWPEPDPSGLPEIRWPPRREGQAVAFPRRVFPPPPDAGASASAEDRDVWVRMVHPVLLKALEEALEPADHAVPCRLARRVRAKLAGLGERIAISDGDYEAVLHAEAGELRCVVEGPSVDGSERRTWLGRMETRRLAVYLDRRLVFGPPCD